MANKARGSKSNATKPPFAVAIGFRDVPDNHDRFAYTPGKSSRQAIHDWVVDRYHALWPSVPVVESAGTSEKFNRSEARNQAVREAFELADVVLIADADVAPTFDATKVALRGIHNHPEKIKWATPYTRYVKANRMGTRKLMNGLELADLDARELGWETDTGTAGLMLVTREAWQTIGGYDETFTEWGWEDWALVVALQTLVHGVTRTHGVCVHLEHDRARDRRRQKARMEHLYQPYMDAFGDQDAMSALLRDRGVMA